MTSLLLELDEERGAIHLQLLGSCDGCPILGGDAAHRRGAAIAEAAPEIIVIDVEEPSRPGRHHARELGPPPTGGAMTVTETGPGDGAAADPLQVLSRIRATQPRERPRPGERCEMCSTPIPDEHDHVVDMQQRSLQCACRGCYLLFTPPGRAASAIAPFPTDTCPSRASSLSPAQWDELQIPVSVAFFFLNSSLERVAAFYPGPAGATESLLSLDAWDEVVAANPGLATLLPDVEALLVRTRSTPMPAPPSATWCPSTPVTSWWDSSGDCGAGFDGGREAHDALEAFFAAVRARARPADGADGT